MKKVLVAIGVLVGFMALGAMGMLFHTKSFSPEDIAIYEKESTKVAVTYCQPYKKHREIFGKLIKYGEVWRTGANEATIFNTTEPIFVNGEQLSAGTYSLWTVPDEKSWTVIFNKEYGQWGINLIDGTANYNQAQDVLRVEVPAYQSSKEFEQFTIQFEQVQDGFEMIMVWDKTMVVVPMELSLNK